MATQEKTYLQAISDGLRQEMRRDQRVFVLGEDVGVYGGAFKVTQGFQSEFGPWRVLDAPLWICRHYKYVRVGGRRVTAWSN